MEPELRDFADVGIVVQAYLKDAEDDIARPRSVRQGTRHAVHRPARQGRVLGGRSASSPTRTTGPCPSSRTRRPPTPASSAAPTLLLAAWPAPAPRLRHPQPALDRPGGRQGARAGPRRRRHRVPDALRHGGGLRDAVARRAIRTRVYVPVGAVIPGMAYLVRRLLENTSNQSWFIARRPRRDAGGAPGAAAMPVRSAVGRHARMPRCPSPTRRPPQLPRADSTRSAMHAALDTRAPRLRRDPAAAHRRHARSPTATWTKSATRPTRRSLLGRVAQAHRRRRRGRRRSTPRAFPAWRDLPARRARGDILRRAADLLEERRFELAALDGLRERQALARGRRRRHRGHRLPALLRLRGRAPGAAGADAADVPRRRRTRYLREARGVAAVIAPWNFPLAIICRHEQRGALAAGNCAILKPAEQSPLIAARLVEILREAGVPAGRRPVPARARRRRRQGARRAPGVDDHRLHRQQGGRPRHHRVGRRSCGRASATSSASIAEMGGKNAIIVDDDADLDQAVAGVVGSAFGYAGQKCSACSRLIVVGSAYDEVVARLAAAVESLVVGPPHEPATVRPARDQRRGPRAHRGLHRRAASRRRASSSRARAPARRRPLRRAHGLRRRRRRTTPLAREEIFGPVLSVFRAETSTRRWSSPSTPSSRSPAASTRATRATSSWRGASSASATSTSTARSPAPSSAASRSAASACPASARRPAGRTTCCSSCARAPSPRTPCAAASRRSTAGGLSTLDPDPRSLSSRGEGRRQGHASENPPREATVGSPLSLR